jgi:hypothetical protein
MPTHMLTAGQVDRYGHDGYLLPFPALSPYETAECLAGLERFERWLSESVTEADRKWRSAGHVFLPWVYRRYRENYTEQTEWHERRFSAA